MSPLSETFFLTYPWQGGSGTKATLGRKNEQAWPPGAHGARPQPTPSWGRPSLLSCSGLWEGLGVGEVLKRPGDLPVGVLTLSPVCARAPATAVCVRRRVPRLIYTSTVNVAFGGKPIEQGDEDSVPYFPLDQVLTST